MIVSVEQRVTIYWCNFVLVETRMIAGRKKVQSWRETGITGPNWLIYVHSYSHNTLQILSKYRIEPTL